MADDNWSQDGEKITSPDKLDAIRAVLETDGPILVEHKFLRGARGPATLVFSDFENFDKYLGGCRSNGPLRSPAVACG